MDRRVLERLLQTFFRARSRGVVCVYLFGSRARGSARPGSDVDLAILFDRRPRGTLEDLPLLLEADLERHVGLPVQVVRLNDAPPDLVHRVLRDGRLLVDRDHSRRIRFEVRSRNEYFDMQPILEEYRYPNTRSRR